MKKVLIITYYWPPSGGSGVRRWLNFSNNFHAYDWKPVVFKPMDASYPSLDETLGKTIHPETEIVKSNIVEPFKIYSKFLGNRKEKGGNTPGVLFTNEKPGFKEKFSVWIRSNFFIPDARMLWKYSAVKVLSKYLSNNKVDLIISTGPPHTTHLIAQQVSKKFDIPWIADFRDPWTKIDFFHKLKLSKRALNRHKRLERSVLESSQLQTTVSWSWADDFKQLGAKNIHVVTNGFDPHSFSTKEIELDSNFTITHLGSMNEDRNHEEFWRSIRELIDENKDFKEKVKIQLIGEIVEAVKKDIAKYKLNEYCTHIPFVTHPEAMKIISKSRLLYLPLNNTPNVAGIVPGKIFEYLASKRPILAIGPTNGDSAKILDSANNGIICNFGDFKKIKDSIMLMYNNFIASCDVLNSDAFQKYSRENLSRQYISLMEKVISK